jgi:Asp-tRNA(Asn)/Glu-tRNA(Gln) amidotransferase A subunit family amidase
LPAGVALRQIKRRPHDAAMTAASDPAFLSIAELSAAFDARRLDPAAVTGLMLARIEAHNPALNAYIRVCAETALATAGEASARAAAGRRRGTLDGIPVALKDNIDLLGVPTSNGFAQSENLRPWRLPRDDAEVVRRLRAAGAVILGKLNMHEGALGATSDNPHFGTVINPHRAGFTPGGSSGGSGAAVAAGLCAAALGSDTGGSVRIPASYCGVVGFKPSFGLVSTRGVVPLSWHLDHVGPLTRRVEDARILFEALRGFDPACPDSRRSRAGDPVAAPMDGLRLGVLRNFKVEPAVAAAFAKALRVFERLGGKIREIALSSYDSVRARRAALLRIEADAALIHADLYEQEPERFSPAIRRYLDYGARASATQLAGAERLIDVAAAELERAFDELDAIVSPATPQPAFAFGADPPDNQNAFCILANFAGAPAISVPMGRTEDGLPLGLQIMTARDRDTLALQLAEAYEKATGWRLDPPPPFGPR